MYQDHPVFKTPDDSTTIWRYTTWGRLCDLLVKRSLFFARATTFDDPWENSYPEGQFSSERAAEEWRRTQAFHGFTVAEVEAHRLQALANAEEKRPETAVSCWHIAPTESDSHWRIYGRNDEGVAIRSTIGDMKRALDVDQERVVHIGEVEYIDFQNGQISLNSGFSAIVHKRREFAHDREVRAVVWEKERKYGGQVLPPFGQGGIHVAVDVGALLQELVVSPLAHRFFEDTVSDIINRFEVSCAVRRSKLLDAPAYRVTRP